MKTELGDSPQKTQESAYSHQRLVQVFSQIVGLITYKSKQVNQFGPSSKQLVSSISTGFLIAENIVMTCAHNIIPEYRNLKVLTQTICFTRVNSKGVEEERKVTKIIVPKEYVSKKTKDQHKFKYYDYVILLLAQPSKSNEGLAKLSFPILRYEEQTQTQTKDDIFGYGYLNETPISIRFYQLLNPSLQQKNNSEFMKLSPGKIIKYNDHNIFHSLKLSEGSSGTPLFYSDGERLWLAAIHKGIDNREEKSVAITLDVMIDQLEQWRKEYGLDYTYLQF